MKNIFAIPNFFTEMEYLKDVDKYQYLCCLTIPDNELHLMIQEAVKIFSTLSQHDKNKYYGNDIDIPESEMRILENGGYDRNNETQRIIQYICRKERTQGQSSFSVFDTVNNTQVSYLMDGTPMIMCSPSNKRVCEVCSNTEAWVCSKCKKVYYCSKKCQKEHWVVHKIVCK